MKYGSQSPFPRDSEQDEFQDRLWHTSRDGAFSTHPQLLYMRYVARVPINSMNVSIEKGVIVRFAYDARLPQNAPPGVLR